MFLEICMQIHSVVFALRRQINKQKYTKTINLLCADNKTFVTYQTQGGLAPPLRMPLDTRVVLIWPSVTLPQRWGIFFLLRAA